MACAVHVAAIVLCNNSYVCDRYKGTQYMEMYTLISGGFQKENWEKKT